MRDLDDKDLRKLFRAAGHHRPAQDLGTRILARVSVTPIAKRQEPPPLIGRWGWAGIGSMLVLPFVVALLSGPSAGTASVPYLDPVVDMLKNLRLPDGDWPVWMIGGSLITLLMVALDRSLRVQRVRH